MTQFIRGPGRAAKHFPRPTGRARAARRRARAAGPDAVPAWRAALGTARSGSGQAGPVSLIRMARNSRGVPRSTVSRGSGHGQEPVDGQRRSTAPAADHRAAAPSPAGRRRAPPRRSAPRTARTPRPPYPPPRPAPRDACFSRRRAKRCCEVPPAALRPCTSRVPTLDAASRGHRAGEHPGRVAAEPDQQHAHGAVSAGVRRDPLADPAPAAAAAAASGRQPPHLQHPPRRTSSAASAASTPPCTPPASIRSASSAGPAASGGNGT